MNFFKKIFLTIVTLSIIASLSLTFTGCPKAPVTEEPTEEAAATEEPTVTEEPEAPAADLGTADNPLVMVFAPSGEADRILASGEKVEKMIEEITGYEIESIVATNYAAMIESMGAGNTHIGWLATVQYVMAKEKYDVDALLTSVRYGLPTYKGQIIVHADSGIETIADLEGKTFGTGDQLSTSGFIFPMALLAKEGYDYTTFFSEIKTTGSHDATVLAVYNKEVDCGSTYDDARGTIEDEFPDVKEKVTVLLVTDDIPNDTFSVIKDMPDEMKENLKNALLEVIGTEEGLAELKEIYSHSGYIPADDSMYDVVREAMKLVPDLFKEE